MQRTVKQTVGGVVLVVACWAGAAGGASYLDPDMVGAFVDLTKKNKLVGDFVNTLFELLRVDSNYRLSSGRPLPAERMSTGAAERQGFGEHPEQRERVWVYH